MRIAVEHSGRPEALQENLRTLDADPAVRSILVLAADANGHTPTELDPVLAAVETPLFGGIFPEFIHAARHYQQGSVAVGLPFAVETTVIEELSHPDTPLEDTLAETFASGVRENDTLFVFVDGFSDRIGLLVEELFMELGSSTNYIGGGCGSLSLTSQPSVLTNRGLKADAVCLALARSDSGIGVAHGWTSISQAFKVTEARGNTIHSLDWQPAFEVYREAVEEHSGRELTAEGFFDLAKAYPFGLAKLDAEMVVRDPIRVEDQSLVCVGGVPTGSFVHILHGSRTSLPEAAARARDRARADRGDAPAELQLFIDCVSRVLFLEDTFARELEQATDGTTPMVGALTIGEIANSGSDYVEFYNKTAVIGLF